MKIFLLILSLFISVTASADLLDRMKLEETFKNRIEDALRLYDPQARAVLRFEYKNFNGALPGMADETQTADITPRSIEPADIARLSVEIYSRIDVVSADIKTYVQRVIPLDKSKVSIEYKKLSPLTDEAKIPAPLDSKSFSDILHDAISSFSKFIIFSLGGIVVLALAFMYVQDTRKLKEFKVQVQSISKMMTEREPTSLPIATTPLMASRALGRSPSSDQNSLKKQDLRFLKEIFADCYWCHEDGYAHWLWKNLDSSQKTELIANMPLMKEYSLHFFEIEESELSYHEHPYYLEPVGLLLTSQEDLSRELRADYSLWHFLSPMRQQNLPLSLEERLKAVQTKPNGKKPQRAEIQESPLRVLETKSTWGEISSEDERTIFTQPEMVPVALRENIRSLVWLAHKDDASIQRILSKFDARSLASAWVGPEEVLKKLESQMPEKKLKMLLTYREKMTPTRNSDVYVSLVNEGLRNEAA